MAAYAPAKPARSSSRKHTCQYGDATCAACAAGGRGLLTQAAVDATRQAMERSRNYRSQDHIESQKLPKYLPGADGYGADGEPRYKTRRAYIRAGERCGMRWH